MADAPSVHHHQLLPDSFMAYAPPIVCTLLHSLAQDHITLHFNSISKLQYMANFSSQYLTYATTLAGSISSTLRGNLFYYATTLSDCTPILDYDTPSLPNAFQVTCTQHKESLSFINDITQLQGFLQDHMQGSYAFGWPSY